MGVELIIEWLVVMMSKTSYLIGYGQRKYDYICNSALIHYRRLYLVLKNEFVGGKEV